MEFLDAVNENDEIVGRASVHDVYERKLTHRIVHVFVFNKNGEMLLQLRNHETKFCPFHWCTAAAGHVKSGETYEKAAERELEEETHIKAIPMYLCKDMYEADGVPKKFLATLKAEYDETPMPGDKVERLEFFALDEIQDMINSSEKFHPELLFLLRRHYGIK